MASAKRTLPSLSSEHVGRVGPSMGGRAWDGSWSKRLILRLIRTIRCFCLRIIEFEQISRQDHIIKEYQRVELFLGIQ